MQIKSDPRLSGGVFVDADGPDALHSFVTTLGRRCGDDPEFTAIYLEYDAELEWPPDDPRLPALAERTQGWLADRSVRPTGQRPNTIDPAIVDLAATLTGPSSPAWDRLSELAQQHQADRLTSLAPAGRPPQTASK